MGEDGGVLEFGGKEVVVRREVVMEGVEFDVVYRGVKEVG